MNIKDIKRNIKGVFKFPTKKYYFGKLRYGAPYFYPRNFSSSIIRIKKVTKRSEEEISKLNDWAKTSKSCIYNLPMVLRSKFWIIKLFNRYYWIEIGSPIKIVKYGLGWKDKFGTPRFEWTPSFQILFFNWQFCIHWTSPDDDNDLYYEMILWYINYANKDINEAEKTWDWVNYETKESTWNKEYLI